MAENKSNHYIPVSMQAFWDPAYKHNGGHLKSKKTKVFSMNLKNGENFRKLFWVSPNSKFCIDNLYTITFKNKESSKVIEKQIMSPWDAKYPLLVNSIISENTECETQNLEELINFMAIIKIRHRRNVNFYKFLSMEVSKELPENFLDEKEEVSEESKIMAKVLLEDNLPSAMDFYGHYQVVCIFDFQEDCLFLGEDPVYTFESPNKDDLFTMMPLTPRYAIFLFKDNEEFIRIRSMHPNNIAIFINNSMLSNSLNNVLIPGKWIRHVENHQGFGVAKFVSKNAIESHIESYKYTDDINEWDMANLQKGAKQMANELRDGSFKSKRPEIDEKKYKSMINNLFFIKLNLTHRISNVMNRYLTSTSIYYFI